MTAYGVYNVDKFRTEIMCDTESEAQQYYDNSDYKEVLEVKEFTVFKLDPLYIEILKSFRHINNAIIFGDQETAVVSVDHSITGQCKLFKMPQEFALDSLAKFLSMFNFVNTSTIYLSDKNIYMQSEEDDKDEKTYETIFSSGLGIAEVRPNFELDDKFPPLDISFELSKKNIADMKKASNILSIDTVAFSFKGNELIIDVSDKDAKTPSDLCKIKIEIDNPQNLKFELLFRSGEFNLLNTDYSCQANTVLAVFRAKPINEIDVGLAYYVSSGVEKD